MIIEERGLLPLLRTKKNDNRGLCEFLQPLINIFSHDARDINGVIFLENKHDTRGILRMIII
jgi:hypothetical protein